MTGNPVWYAMLQPQDLLPGARRCHNEQRYHHKGNNKSYYKIHQEFNERVYVFHGLNFSFQY